MVLLYIINMVLPLLFAFRPSGVGDVSRSMQELALAPYVITEAQKGIIYGIGAYESLPPVTTVFRALFSSTTPLWLDASAAEVVLASDFPKHKSELRSTCERCLTSILQVNSLLHAPVSPRPVIFLGHAQPNLQWVSESPGRPTCSPLDSPALVNISRVISDPHITRDVVLYSPPANPLNSTGVFLSVIIVALVFLGALVDFCCDKISVPIVLYWFKIFLGVTSCGIVGKYQLSKDADPQVALIAMGVGGYMLREMNIVAMLCSISRMVCIWNMAQCFLVGLICRLRV
jgi:hypothetical protein